MPHADPNERRAYLRRWMAQRRAAGIHYDRDWRRMRREALDALKGAPCADCGGAFPPVCMDWHHVRGEKVGTIGSLAWRRMDVILAEIAKCELLCANCHRLRDHDRGE